jgi:hypothetical protein
MDLTHRGLAPDKDGWRVTEAARDCFLTRAALTAEEAALLHAVSVGAAPPDETPPLIGQLIERGLLARDGARLTLTGDGAGRLMLAQPSVVEIPAGVAVLQPTGAVGYTTRPMLAAGVTLPDRALFYRYGGIYEYDASPTPWYEERHG